MPLFIVSEPDAGMPAPGEKALVTVYCEVAADEASAARAVAISAQQTEGAVFIVGGNMKRVTVPAPTFSGISVDDISAP